MREAPPDETKSPSPVDFSLWLMGSYDMVEIVYRERFDEIGKKIKRESDAAAATQMGRRHMLGPPGTLNTITPCAACKLLRRRCAQECPFSPYFSPHEPQKFASVHKVFGASNVSKMLMEVPESQRADAANSLVYEANVRLRDPVYGCMGAISALQQQVQTLQAELNACFPSQNQATRVMAVLDILSNHFQDEEYLGDQSKAIWDEDPVIKAAFERFNGR
ncbi:hypothetical protein FEM48_Zijuj03G0115000 [Ziziphus jujuba var. spinosa]|uniref:LOB domain-containing protein n=1 Tax=Ziziphus jujuba var. spinosa TaxID=714518 RepID=A0A978VQ22_ZIZJJ|nr:hypothetical protein FEM48_Zijuj03G0115000 [Ziziphus jujuba var. spinosa]